jgi:hypothetical protein
MLQVEVVVAPNRGGLRNTLTTLSVPHPDLGLRLAVRPVEAHFVGRKHLVRTALGAGEFDAVFLVEGVPTAAVPLHFSTSKSGALFSTFDR